MMRRTYLLLKFARDIYVVSSYYRLSSVDCIHTHTVHNNSIYYWYIKQYCAYLIKYQSVLLIDYSNQPARAFVKIFFFESRPIVCCTLVPTYYLYMYGYTYTMIQYQLYYLLSYFSINKKMDIIHYYYLFCFARLHNRHYHRAYVRLYMLCAVLILYILITSIITSNDVTPPRLQTIIIILYRVGQNLLVFGVVNFHCFSDWRTAKYLLYRMSLM